MFNNNSRLIYLGAAIFVAFTSSGCLSPGSRLATTPNDGSKSKTRVQDLAGTDDGLDRSDKERKAGRKVLPTTGTGKEKLAAESTKKTSQVDELIKEGDLLRKNKQYEDARVVYHKALLLSPESPVVNHRLAIIADKQRLFSAADYHYLAALKARPQDVNLLSDHGYSYSLRGNEEQAEETLKKALRIDPKHKGAMANLGALYAHQNRYSDAFAMFRAGATEEETQRYLAKLFPKERSGDEQIASADRRSSNGLTGSLPPENNANVSSMSIEDLEAELDRRKHDVAVRRQIQNQIQSLPSMAERGQSRVSGVNVRGLNGLQPSWDQDEVTGASATMDSTKSQNSVSHSNNSRESDAPVQTAWGQEDGMPADTNQQVNKSDQSRQLATQLALSAGPGNMFPILSGFTFKRPDNDKIVPVGMSFDSTGNGRTEFAGRVKIEKGKADGSSRPYDGTWPNTTNPSPKQNLNTTFKGGMSEAVETSSLNSQIRNGSFSKLNAATSNQTSEMSSLWSSNSPSARPSSGSSAGQWPNSSSSGSAPTNNSTPQWPFSSNR
ncbi:MAG: tetratricopeptide repeat protein [Schlesneria sp.]